MTSNNEESHRQLLQMVAMKIGHYHKPKVYIDYIKQNYDVDVSSSSTTKALGALYSRLRTEEPAALDLAKRLLDSCYQDRGLANYFVNKAGLGR